MSNSIESLVSIIVPMYKVKPYIADCIESIINQTFRNIEIILIDDGDPDESWKIAEQYLKGSPCNYTIIHQSNRGLSEARNIGLKNAKGEFVYYLDSDDMILSNTISLLVKCANKQTDIVFCNWKQIKNKESITEELKYNEPVKYSANQIQKAFLTRRRVMLAPGTLFRREFLIANELFFRTMPWSEDQCFIWEVLHQVKEVVFLDEALYQYRLRKMSIMTGSNREKIIDSYPEIKHLAKLYEDVPFVQKYLEARWVFGCLNASTRFLTMTEWNLLYSELDSSHHLKVLLSFPDIITKVRSFFCLVYPNLYYKIVRRILNA